MNDNGATKYRHSNTEVWYEENGKKRVYKVCDVCGAEQQNNFGCEFSYAMRGSLGHGRMALCGKCANQIIPIFIDAIYKMHDMERVMRHVSAIGQSTQTAYCADGEKVEE